jgi:hypothetical protein
MPRHVVIAPCCAGNVAKSWATYRRGGMGRRNSAVFRLAMAVSVTTRFFLWTEALKTAAAISSGRKKCVSHRDGRYCRGSSNYCGVSKDADRTATRALCMFPCIPQASVL